MKAAGFTLVEWLVAMVLGLFLLAGVLSVFVAARSNTGSAIEQSSLLENGRLAMRLLTQDLRWAGFWGDYTGLPMQVGSGLTLSNDAMIARNAWIADNKECLDERSEGSLPSTAAPARAIWIAHIDSSKAMSGLGCVTASNRIADSDVLTIRRLIGLPQSSALDDNRFYLATTSQSAYLFPGAETPPDETAMPNRQIWEYQYHLYYLYPSAGGGHELRKRMLTVNGGSWLISGALVSGVEKMVLQCGVDSSVVADGKLDKFVAASDVTAQEWNEGRVLAVRVYLLMRAEQADRGYVNRQIYQLGHVTVSGNGDGYRRLLLESTVALRNPLLVAGGGE